MNYEPVFFFSPFTINHSLFLIVIPERATPFVIPEWATPFVIPEWFYRGSSISLSLSYRRRPVSSIYFFLVPGFRREDDVVVPGFPPSSVESFGLDCLSFYLQPSQKDLSEQRGRNDSSTEHAGMTVVRGMRE